MNFIPKPWGGETTFVTNEKSTVKIMEFREHKRNSLHCHMKKDEIVYCVSGTGMLQVNTEMTKLVPGTIGYIQRNIIHRITAFENLKVLEISLGEYDEDDIKRFEDDFNRCDNK